MANEIKIGASSFDALKIGSADVDAAYIGDTLVYSGGTTPTPSLDNIIEYTASAKLPETTTAYASGLHTNAFSGTSGQLTISSHTFANGVGTIEFNGVVKTIGDAAFRQCSGVTSIIIPPSVSAFNAQPFWGCTSLTDITIKATTAPTFNGLVFDNTNNCTIYVPCNSIADYSVAIKDGLLIDGYKQLINPWTTRLRGISSCTTIARWNDSGTTCSGQSGYDKYTIAALQLSLDSGSTWSYVSPIQSYASSIEENSQDCGYTPPTTNNTITYEAHSEIFFNDSEIYGTNGEPLTVVSHDFDDNQGTIVFDGEIGIIGDKAFQYCSNLESINIPSGVTSIGNYAFEECYSLKSIYSYPTTPPSLGVNAFADTNDCPIYVPSEAIGLYQSEWYYYEYRIQGIY